MAAKSACNKLAYPVTVGIHIHTVGIHIHTLVLTMIVKHIQFRRTFLFFISKYY